MKLFGKTRNPLISSLFVILALLLVVGAACTSAAPAPTVTVTATTKVTTTATTTATPTPTTPAPKPPLKVGASLGLTGPFAVFGLPAKEGIEFTVAELNKKGGIMGRKVEAIILDDAGDAAKGAENIKRFLFQDKVEIVVANGLTGGTLSANEIVLPTNVLSYQWGFARGSYNPQILSMLIPIADNDALATKFIVNQLGYKRIGWVGLGIGSGKEGLDAHVVTLRELGITADSRLQAPFAVGTKDWTTQILQVKSGNPEIVWIWAAASDFPTIVRQVQQLIPGVPMFGMSAIAVPSSRNVAGDSVNGMYYTNFMAAANSPDPNVQAFIKKIEAFTGKGFDETHSRHYTGLTMLADAIEEAKTTDRTAVMKVIASWKNKPTLYGLFNLDTSTGIGISSVMVSKIVAGADISRDQIITILKTK